MRTQSIVAVLAAAVLLPVAVASPAQAAVAPVFVTPDPGSIVSGVTEVSATSTAAFVRFEAYAGPTQRLMALVPTSGGTATWPWESYGFGGTTRLVATACASNSASTCDGMTAATVNVSVANPVADFQAPTSTTIHNPDTDAPLVVSVQDDVPGSLLYFAHGGTTLAAATPGVPTTLEFPDPPYTTVVAAPVTVRRCNGVDPDICTAEAMSAEVVVRRSIEVTADLPVGTTISPNNDGWDEAFNLAVRAGDPGISLTQATWIITDSGGTPLLAPTPFPNLASVAAGTVQQIRPTQLGLTLTDGDYLVRVDVTGTQGGREFTGRASTEFTVDLTGPAIDSITFSSDTFFPVKDALVKQYANNVSVDVVGDHSGTAGSIAAVDADGKHYGLIVRGSTTTPTGWRFTWNGQDYTEHVLPEGDYRLELTSEDDWHNVTVAQSGLVTISHSAYVGHVWAKFVSARTTLHRNWSGRCGLLRKPGLRGGKSSIGYYSNGRCGTRNVDKGAAVGLHRVRVPAADAYGQIDLIAHGGPIDRGNRAGLTTWSTVSDQPLGDTVTLSARWGWHQHVKRPGADMVWPDRSIYWVVGCAYGQRYDVSRLRVEVNYATWNGPSGTEPSTTSGHRWSRAAPEPATTVQRIAPGA